MTARLGARILVLLVIATLIAGTIGVYRAMLPEI